jgi:hypothetical protein
MDFSQITSSKNTIQSKILWKQKIPTQQICNFDSLKHSQNNKYSNSYKKKKTKKNKVNLKKNTWNEESKHKRTKGAEILY